jgi:hypothetical protein
LGVGDGLGGRIELHRELCPVFGLPRERPGQCLDVLEEGSSVSVQPPVLQLREQHVPASFRHRVESFDRAQRIAHAEVPSGPRRPRVVDDGDHAGGPLLRQPAQLLRQRFPHEVKVVRLA